MGERFQQQIQQHAVLQHTHQDDRNTGKHSFNEAKGELQAAAPGLSDKSAQGVMAAMDDVILRKITGCPMQGIKPRVHIEETTGIAMHYPGTPEVKDEEGNIIKKAQKTKAYPSRLIDDLDVQANRAMTISRLVVANHVPKVANELNEVATTNHVPAMLDSAGQVVPARTTGVGMKRTLMETQVVDDATGVHQNLDQGLNIVLGVLGHGAVPLDQRLKRRALMNGSSRRVLKGTDVPVLAAAPAMPIMELAA